MKSSLRMVDTDIASYFIKGRSPAVDARWAKVDPSLICISAVTKSELLYGLKDLDSTHRLHFNVRRFLNATVVLPWDEDAA